MLIYARVKTSLMAILRNESYEIVSNFQTNKNPIVLWCELNVDHQDLRSKSQAFCSLCFLGLANLKKKKHQRKELLNISKWQANMKRFPAKVERCRRGKKKIGEEESYQG